MDLTKKFKKAVLSQGYSYRPTNQDNIDQDSQRFNQNSSEILEVMTCF